MAFSFAPALEIQSEISRELNVPNQIAKMVVIGIRYTILYCSMKVGSFMMHNIETIMPFWIVK